MKNDKVQLIYPYFDEKREEIGAGWTQPLGILSIASYIKNKIPSLSIEVLDGSIMPQEQLEKKIDADIVGLSTTICNYENSLKIAQIAKAKNAKVIFGGPFATFQNKKILANREYVDAVIVGDGEQAFYEYIAGARRESISNLCYRDFKEIKINNEKTLDLNTLPIVDYSFVQLESYFRNFQKIFPNNDSRSITFYSQKGCKWREYSKGCIFCSIPSKKWRAKNPFKVWLELEQIIKTYNVDYIYETSDDFLADKIWIRNLAKLKPKNINPKFRIFARADRITNDIIKYLKKINVHHVLIGIESGSSNLFFSVKKGYSIKQNNKALESLKQNKIKFSVSFVIGLLNENEKTIRETLDYSKKLKENAHVEEVIAFIMTPLPGSCSYEMLMKVPQLSEKYRCQDLLLFEELEKDWLRYFTHIDFTMAKKAVEEIRGK